MQLYKISETVVTNMIGASGSKPGNNTIVRERSGFKYPHKMDINTLLTYKLELDQTIMQPHEV